MFESSNVSRDNVFREIGHTPGRRQSGELSADPPCRVFPPRGGGFSVPNSVYKSIVPNSIDL